MHARPLVLLLAGLGTACAHTDPRLWDAALGLDRPDRTAQAEETLNHAGAEGIDVLLRTARAGGESTALQAVLLTQPCPALYLGLHPGHRERDTRSPSLSAARLLARRALAEPPLLQRLVSSPEPFERQLAFASLAGEPTTLLATLPRLEHEHDARVLMSAEQALSCAGFVRTTTASAASPEALRAGQRRLEEWMKARLPERRCDTPADMKGEQQEGLATGAWSVAGWGSSGHEFTLHLETDQGVRVNLGPACALAMYDALAHRGVYLSGLVLPLGTEAWLSRDIRQEAARRAITDLSHYPESQRNRIAAELVNAGHEVPVNVAFQADNTFAQAEELEAAARQKQPGARPSIERYVFCRGTFGTSGISLLGYVATPEAAQSAYELATRCPGALGEATTALVRLEDTRAVELLGPALENPGFARDELILALLEHATPAVHEKLRALEAGGSQEAAGILQRMRERADEPR
ncbi:hypothetical protein [Melittangium boletus]|uniref:Lipoprotein n=1 Tax=Melittangium boletus DSM 14713 TaxID=1294270 RepID=A0A250IBV1_9BACT|nr:hypothetical protein [Melittangium boletus]ATB29319.1 hypothetical protein MEBOL_002768 [Melittangium boletus DSM 14713]